jgi:hypothetical protein
MGESSEAVSQPPGVPAAAALRTVSLISASPDAEAPNQVCQFLESCSSLQGSTKWTRYSLQALFA